MSQCTVDVVHYDDARTLDDLFYARSKRSPERVGYRSFERDLGEWNDTRWDEMAIEVERWRAALAREGLKCGDRVALTLRNCKEWVIFDQAALSLGLVTVPLYTDDRPDNIAFILNDATVRLLLVQDTPRWNRLSGALAPEAVPSLERIIVLWGGAPQESDKRVLMAGEWLSHERMALEMRNGDPQALATIVYTSGTTGRPKGVMLSHYNILSIAHSGLTMIPVYPNDIFLSFLPLSHALERTAGYYLPMISGSTVAYARSVPSLADDLASVQPTILIAVPRIFERIYGRIQRQLEKGSAFSRALFQLAVRVGWQRFEHHQGRSSWHPSQLLWPLLNGLVARKILARLGGHLRLVISGGAALSPAIAHRFIGLGVPLLQGYGLTETSPVISVNMPENNVPESVGVPLHGIQVRIGEESELQVNTPGCMLGYWNNSAATATTIDPDGWLHTGDQARIGERGHIYITGRIKDILVLSNGEKVPPGDMENAILLDPLFEQIAVVGEGRSHLTALVVLNSELWPERAREMGIKEADMADMSSRHVVQPITRRISELLSEFPSWARVRNVFLILEPWTIENDLLTPTMKVKRQKVLEHYRDAIETMYR